MTDVVESNRQMHAEWHELNSRWQEACEKQSADVDRLKRERDAVGTRFIEQNLPYARKLVSKWSRVAPSNRDDYLAAAYEKLWSAFLSWDPTKGTFSTWARSHIEGGVRREVNRQEFGERSYDDFVARPQVVAAKERLAEQLGRSPSLSELRAATGIPESEVTALLVALGKLSSPELPVSAAQLGQAAGLSTKVASRFLRSHRRLSDELGRSPSAQEVSADTGMSQAAIERALVPRAARLDAAISSDGTATLGDKLAERLTDPELFGDDQEWLAYLAETCRPLNGQQVWTLIRLEGLDGADPQKMRDVAAQIDVGRETVRRADDTARKLIRGPVPSADPS